MKKLVLIAAVVVMSAAAVSAFVYVNNGKNSMGELFNANVEALTAGENSSHTTWSCDGSVLVSCHATCGLCGTTISASGNLTGMHRCY